MNKTTLNILIVIALTTIVSISIFYISSSVLMYSEGMGTFYWDRHILREQISQNGVGEIMRTFFLQFFATPGKGVTVMTIGTVLVAITSLTITRRQPICCSTVRCLTQQVSLRYIRTSVLFVTLVWT